LRGHDTRDGRLLQIEGFGVMDMMGMLKATSKEELIRFAVANSEYIETTVRAEAKDTGKPCRKLVMIQNLAGVSSRQIRSDFLAMLQAVLHVIVENYPERMAVAYFVNLPAPKLFSIGWGIIKGLFDENLKRKFVFMTASDWNTQLREVVADEHLPAYLGGTLRDPDDACSNLLGTGGIVPDSLFRMNDDSFSVVVVPARGAHRIEILAIAGSVVSWEFTTKGYDIKFGVYYVGTEEEAQEVLKTKHKGDTLVDNNRVQGASQEVISGEIFADKSGVYLLEWDNGYSFMRSKTLMYKYEVASPKENAE